MKKDKLISLAKSLKFELKKDELENEKYLDLCLFNSLKYSQIINFNFKKNIIWDKIIKFSDIFKSNFLLQTENESKKIGLGFKNIDEGNSKIIKFNKIKKNNDFFLIKEQALKIYEKNKYLNSTITPTFENTPLSSESIIYNVPYSLKDLFCTKDIKTTGGSKFYKNFTPNYSSTVYEMLSRNGGYLVGKDTCDEFGCGGSGFECSAIGDIPVINFHNEKKVVLGSCSGSANKVASSEVIFSIGVDTCDSVRHPASLVGIVGYKPTYGLISRYGTFSFCNTMDTVGILAQNVSDAGIIANILIRYDEKDMTSQIICTKDEKVNRNGIIQTSEKKIKVGIIKFNDEQWDDEEIKKSFKEGDIIKKEYEQLKHKFNDDFEYVDINLPSWINEKLLFELYHVICYSDFFSNRAKDTGINTIKEHKFIGDYYQHVFQNRSELYSFNTKKKMLLGTQFINKGIDRIASKIRDLLITYFNELFKTIDCFLLPGSGDIAPDINFKIHNYTRNQINEYLKLANYCGFCSITIPFGKAKNMPFGLNINCKQFDDFKLLNIARKFEDNIKYGKE